MISPEKIAEMLPCPFCGSTHKLAVTVYRAAGDGGEPFGWGFTVICNAAGFSHAKNRGCGGSGAWGETEAEAIEAWNRRAPSPELLTLRAERDEARELLEVSTFTPWLRDWCRRRFGKWITHNTAKGALNDLRARSTLSQEDSHG